MPKLGLYDYLTFASLLVILVAGMVVMVFFLGLPGRIARKRNHPEADAIYVMGWLGFLGGVPWIQAFIWAFKPTEVVDIRRFPSEEREALAQEFADHAESSRRRRHATEQTAESSATSDAPSTDAPSTDAANPSGDDSESDSTNQTNDPQSE